ncbi:response regulator [Bradyrhizobium sp. Pa8]|uniref:response regulator n=1 Tax=Bradyrhizobium sp. Pa8 TaxID=3386552 RepID=UPI00403F63BB
MAHTLDIISVVCDDRTVCEPLLNMLISAGCVPDLFQSSDEFLHSKRYISTSCLIADMQLPNASGLDIHEILVASGNAIPTILLLADPDDDNRERALKAGVSHVLRKPFSNGELLACIKAILRPNEASEAPLNRIMPSLAPLRA